MNYEIDFIGVDEDSSKDASATCLRFYSQEFGRYVIVVYDGGFSVHGQAMVKHIKKYYTRESVPYIDIVICSHSDNDHASGLSEIFDTCSVGHLIMNRPWLYASELYPKISDKRKTVGSLERELKETYFSIAELERKALENGTEIHEGFQGKMFSNVPLWILSPTKDFFIQQVIESAKTPLQEDASSSFVKKVFESMRETIKDYWNKDAIREGESTTPENETSIVLFGDMEEDGSFLLTGDAGVQALTNAADYAELLDINLSSVKFHQIPHHGGRHNVSPSVLNRIAGSIQPSGTVPTKSAFVSVAKNSDHPKKMVVNAYIRRGVKVFEARTSSKWHHRGTPDRSDYSSATPLKFSDQVESWN
ncbi:ComEC/Rec2 family competence protein [Anaerotruncus rubiinfantis]|uniref:ComEC/Rec2 family competence protein n=1 Tax=Anaerotruncus rubiinfantis TaxID=1720200 RepID=UPI0034A3DFCD